MDLKTQKVLQDVGEYIAFLLGFSLYTAKEVAEYFMYDFPIARINEYIYTVVLLIAVAAGIKRVWCWFVKSNKAKSNEHD